MSPQPLSRVKGLYSFEILDLLVKEIPNNLFAWIGQFFQYALKGEKDLAIQSVTNEMENGAKWHELNALFMAECYSLIGEKTKAIEWCEKAVRQEPDDLLARIMLTVVYSWSGRDEEARAEAAEVLRIHPKFSLKKFPMGVGYKNQEDKERLIRALHKAGLE